MKKVLIVLSLLLLAVSPFVSADSHQSTMVRVAHLSPDAPAVDVWVNGSVVLNDVPYKAVSDYLKLPAGVHVIEVSPAGEKEPIVIDATVTLNANTSYTVAATGLLSEGDLAPILLIDNRSVVMSNSKVRFVHTSPDAPAVDVALAGGSVLFKEAAFREASDYLELPADTYDLEVRVAGTLDVALDLPGVTLEGGTNYTVFAIGTLEEGTLEALPVIDASTPLRTSSCSM